MRDSLRQPVALGILVAAGLWAGLAGAGFAGSGNVLYLLQDSSAGDAGESFQSDQSRSTNSSIGSLAQSALQAGSGDSASLTIDSTCTVVSASCGHADLTQESDYAGVLATALADQPVQLVEKGSLGLALAGLGSYLEPNSATISVTGQGSAAVSQYGFGNQAHISANDSEGAINQVGLGNTASLVVTALAPLGDPGKFTLNQIGVQNSANIEVSTPAGTSSSYTQIGAYQQYVSAANPTVILSTTSVDVTHTGF